VQLPAGPDALSVKNRDDHEVDEVFGSFGSFGSFTENRTTVETG
jgi:hypothetical protein